MASPAAAFPSRGVSAQLRLLCVKAGCCRLPNTWPPPLPQLPCSHPAPLLRPPPPCSWLSIAASIASFAQISPLAALLFAPTQIWVTIAAKLNLDIVKLNSGAAAKKP